tara:strand:+ start:331 stop:1491 length:1161 start_codon:yes stop_codon:yes gene_type:complete
MLGLGSSLHKAGKVGKSIIRDGLVLRHDYNAGAVEPVSSGAASFDGTSDYIAINAKPVDTADGTYCWWSNSTLTTGQVIFGHGGAQYGAFYLNYGSTDKPLFIIHGNTYQYWADNGLADDGKWHHWALVVDISSMASCKLYCDGVEVDDGTTAQSVDVYDYGNLEIGRVNSSTEFDGYMCNFGVWDVHLTQPQIKSIMHKDYAALSASEKADLVSWWNLDSTLTDTTVLDNHYGGGSELGGELWDSPASTNGSISSWNKYGDNDIATVNGAVQITYKDHTAGAYVYLKNSTVLSTDLTVGAVYKISYDAKVNSGSSVLPQVVQSGSLPNVSAGAVTSTEFITQEIYFVAGHATTTYLKVEFMGTDEIATLDNFSLKLVNGNTGTLA